jgi:hypothetical protein
MQAVFLGSSTLGDTRFAQVAASLATRWAGAWLSGSRAPEARPGRPVFRGLRGFDGFRALAIGPRLIGVVGGPGASARYDPVRLRSKPPPISPRQHLGA